MKTAILVHGSCDREEYFSDQYPSLSNAHWLPWLQKQLIIAGYAAHTPEMPRAYDPDYSIWKAEFERYPLSPESLLIGHSCGGGFLLRWLSENKIAVKRLVLVAPWLNPLKKDAFFDFVIDPSLVKRTEVHILVSENDDEPGIHESIEMIRPVLPGHYFHPFFEYGHFCTGEFPGSPVFPELREIALGRRNI